MKVVAAMCVLLIVTASAFGQVCAEFDASLGSLPDSQGWERFENTSSGPVFASVAGGVMTQSTLPQTGDNCPNTDPTNLRNLDWRINDIPFDFEDGMVFECDLRVIASQDNSCGCGVRTGIFIIVRDTMGRRFDVGIVEGQVVMTNDPFAGACGGPAGIYASVDTTSAFRTYRLEIDGPSAILKVDGTVVAEHNTYGPVTNPGAERVLFGDATSWSNSEFKVRSFSVSQPSCVCLADLAEPFGLLDLADVNAFAQAFLASDMLADLDGNGLLDLSDVNLFVSAFLAGCP